MANRAPRLSPAMSSREAAEVLGMHVRTWRRYWPTQPDIRAAAFRTRTGPRGGHWRFPSHVIAQHVGGLR